MAPSLNIFEKRSLQRAYKTSRGGKTKMYNSLLTANGIITVEMLKAVLKDKDTTGRARHFPEHSPDFRRYAVRVQ